MKNERLKEHFETSNEIFNNKLTNKYYGESPHSNPDFWEDIDHIAFLRNHIMKMELEKYSMQISNELKKINKTNKTSFLAPYIFGSLLLLYLYLLLSILKGYEIG